MPVYKNGGRAGCENCRGVALLCQCVGIFERIVLERVGDVVEANLEEEQQGFGHGGSAVDAMFTV